MGYTNVKRYPMGYHGWLDAFPDQAPDEKATPLKVGDEFPPCSLAVLKNGPDQAYLGLAYDETDVSLALLPSEFVLVLLYNKLCISCVQEAQEMNAFAQEVAASPDLNQRLKIIGLGVYSNSTDVRRFRKKYNITFPLFADREGDIFSCLGQSALPLAYLVQKQGKGQGRRIVLLQTGFIETAQPLFQEVKRMVLNGSD